MPSRLPLLQPAEQHTGEAGNDYKLLHLSVGTTCTKEQGRGSGERQQSKAYSILKAQKSEQKIDVHRAKD